MAGLNFLDLRSLPVKEAEAVILPIPYEATTTYGAGARGGPEAILAASRQVELWDEDYDWDPSAAIRLATAAPIAPEVSGPGAMVEKIKRIVQPWISQGKLICALGGEHTITVALLQAMQTRYPDLTVVSLDAHADMRESYDGSKLSHACVMRRAYELGRPLTLLRGAELFPGRVPAPPGGAAPQAVQGERASHPGRLAGGPGAPPGHLRAGVSLHRPGRPGPRASCPRWAPRNPAVCRTARS